MSYQDISPAEFKEKMQEDVVILDVRTPAEVAEGAIEGHKAMNIMDPGFLEQVETLDPEKTYLVYCRSGGRSGQACQVMSQKGFKNLYNLAGGFMGWQAQN